MKGRKHKADGGELRGDAKTGDRDWEKDLDEKPEARTNAKKIDDEAEERKRGGRAKRKSGGMVHHEDMSKMKHAKHVGMVKGEMAEHHAGRKPRKSGGRTGSDGSPFTTAAKGTPAMGRKTMEIG